MARITLRLPDVVHGELVARSRTAGQSVNQIIVDTLTRSLDHDEAPPVDQRARLLAALGDLVADGLVLDEPGDEDRPFLTYDELWQRLSNRDIRLSEAIITDREDRL